MPAQSRDEEQAVMEPADRVDQEAVPQVQDGVDAVPPVPQPEDQRGGYRQHQGGQGRTEMAQHAMQAAWPFPAPGLNDAQKGQHRNQVGQEPEMGRAEPIGLNLTVGEAQREQFGNLTTAGEVEAKHPDEHRGNQDRRNRRQEG